MIVKFIIISLGRFRPKALERSLVLCDYWVVSSLCHLGFLVRRKAELLPSRWATGQRTPATKEKNSNYVILRADWNNTSTMQISGRRLTFIKVYNCGKIKVIWYSYTYCVMVLIKNIHRASQSLPVSCHHANPCSNPARLTGHFKFILVYWSVYLKTLVFIGRRSWNTPTEKNVGKVSIFGCTGHRSSLASSGGVERFKDSQSKM